MYLIIYTINNYKYIVRRLIKGSYKPVIFFHHEKEARRDYYIYKKNGLIPGPPSAWEFLIKYLIPFSYR